MGVRAWPPDRQHCPHSPAVHHGGHGAGGLHVGSLRQDPEATRPHPGVSQLQEGAWTCMRSWAPAPGSSLSKQTFPISTKILNLYCRETKYLFRLCIIAVLCCYVFTCLRFSQFS